MAETALVTGAAQRIGSEITRELHRAGFDIALHYRHSEGPATALAGELNAVRADSCRLFQADIAILGELHRLADELREVYDRLGLLVNNASGFEPTPIATCTPDEFDAMVDSNLKGPYFLVQALLPLLRAAAGSIVNILDVHVQQPLPGFNAYCAAKAGLASLTRSLAVELGPDIRVNGVAPGAILWPEGGEAYDDAMRRSTVESTPLRRTGEPADIARTVRFLTCDAPFITGQVIDVDGGRSLTG
jgi:pteridine reductase